MTVNCFYSTEDVIDLIYSVLMVGMSLMISVMAGLAVGTIFSIC